MSKSKIEPVTIEQIKKIVEQYDERIILSLVLAWIHAVARAMMLEYLSRHSDCDDECCFFGEEHLEFDGRGELPHFVTAVKREVGWPEDL